MRLIKRVSLIVVAVILASISLSAPVHANQFYSNNEVILYDKTASECSGGGCVCDATVGDGASVGATASENIPEPWRAAIIAAAAKYKINPNFLAALYLSEHDNQWLPFNTTDWDNSHVAYGPMQFVLGTWRSYGVDGNGDGVKDINNVQDALHSTANYMASAIKVKLDTPLGTTTQPLKANTLIRAGASYNWGPGNVGRAGESTPLSALPRETQDYVENIFALLSSNMKNHGKNFSPVKNAGSSKPESTDEDVASGSPTSTCGSGGAVAIVDGFAFPLRTTKAVIQKGADGAKWCYANTSNCHHHYNAADIHAPTGTVVVAAEGGRIVHAKDDGSEVGARITIKGTSGNLYYYAHNGRRTFAPGIAEGKTVTTGQELAKVGTSADAVGTAPHLHFDMLPSSYSSRPSCSSGSCMGYPFINVQPLLVKAYQKLP